MILTLFNKEIPTDEQVELVASGMYGTHWYGPDEKKMPGERMKDVWRRYAREGLSNLLKNYTVTKQDENTIQT